MRPWQRSSSCLTSNTSASGRQSYNDINIYHTVKVLLKITWYQENCKYFKTSAESAMAERKMSVLVIINKITKQSRYTQSGLTTL